ncbi:MAG: hypothetical protein Q9170_006959 [Blastenia crenularia]
MAAKASKQDDTAQDKTSGEEISSTTIPPPTPNKGKDTSQQHNAFTELLSHSKKPSSQPTESPIDSHPPQALTTFSGRSGLGAYTHAPESFPPSRVISYDESYVTINDLYPKSSIHLLLLPRDSKKQLLHPFAALQDPAFLASIQQEVRKLRLLVAKELQRRFGKFSAQERKREEAMEKALDAGEDVDEATLPKGRGWSKDVIAGVHTHPSMSHLHIHVLSIDRHSECMRHRKHYNSFATPFLVDVDDFPLSKQEEVRRRKERWLDEGMVCWRCKRNFGNRFGKLKEHLEGEFEEWKRE